jgi:hypothetical protein
MAVVRNLLKDLPERYSEVVIAGSVHDISERQPKLWTKINLPAMGSQAEKFNNRGAVLVRELSCHCRCP